MISLIVTFSCICSPAAFGSLSICDDTANSPAVPVTVTGSSDHKPGRSFLKVTELVTMSHASTSHKDTGKYSTILGISN